MSTEFICPELIEKIRSTCSKHISGLASADELQRAIQYGEMSIVAIEEMDVRDFLTDVEGKLELIKFTVDEESQTKESKEVAEQVLLWLSERERHGGI